MTHCVFFTTLFKIIIDFFEPSISCECWNLIASEVFFDLWNWR